MQRLSDVIDDMLLGDFEYVLDGAELYADVDYYRRHPHHVDQLTWTPAAGRGLGPQRSAAAGPGQRRPGSVPTPTKVCVAGRTKTPRAATAAGRTRAHR